MNLARSLILTLLASMTHGGTAANNLSLCSAQKDCIDFTIKKSDTFECQPEDDCPLEVCLVLDTTKEGCAKQGPISHLCAASDANGCAAYDADGVTPLIGKGVFTDCGLTGLDGSIAFDGKCEPSEEQTKIVMCQEGLPGTTLYWALKDGAVEDFASYDYTGTFTFVNENYGETCSPKIECTGDSGYECATPMNNMFQLTRVWKYYIPPKDGTPCDMCTPPPPPPLPPEEEEEGQGKGGKGAKGGKDDTGATEPKNNLGTCSAQKDCIDFTIKKADSSSCALTGSCGIEVCMILDTDKESCAKDGPISHLCAASDSNGCAAYDANGKALTGKGDSSDCNLTGEDASAAFDGKCEPTSNKVVMCQEGEPGDTLYWALKDASVVDSGSYDYTGAFTFEKDATTCSPEIECTGDAGLQCADPNNGMYDLTRVWSYTIPDGGACDLCDAAEPIVESPFDVVSPTDPEKKLAEMPNVIIENQDNLDSETFMDEEMSLDSETFDELPESDKIGEDPTPPEDTAEDPAVPAEPETPATPETPVEQPVVPVVEEPASEEDPAVDPTEPADLGAPETPETPLVDEPAVTPPVDEPEQPVVDEQASPDEPETPIVDEHAPEQPAPAEEPDESAPAEEPENPVDPAVHPTKPADLGAPETPAVPEQPASPDEPEVPALVVDPPAVEEPQEPAVEQPVVPAEETSAEEPEAPVVDPTKPADLETPVVPAEEPAEETSVEEHETPPAVEQPAVPAEEPVAPAEEPSAEEPEAPAVEQPVVPAEEPVAPSEEASVEEPAVDPTEPANLETPTAPETPTIDEPPAPSEEPNLPDTPPANGPPAVDPTAVAGLGKANDAAEEPAKEAGSQGDPHFKTWRNEHYEYHGQCDMVLVKDPNFADGLGLDVQIRTKLVRFWSYIQSAAIRIGNDVFEIQGSVDGATFEDVLYWVNFQYLGPITTLGGFPIQVQSHQKAKKQVIQIDLSSKYPGSKIEFQVWKEFIKVDFIQPTAEAFGNTVGMLGDFHTGKTLARDGAKEIHNFSELGNEWQVLPADLMLFHDTAKPQFPTKCIEPEDPRGARRRRLDESSVSYEEAEKACGKLTDALDRKDCIYDIIATQDMTMIGAY